MARYTSRPGESAALAAAIEAAALDGDKWGPLVDLLLLMFDGEGGGINIADLRTGRSRAAINHGLTASAETEYYDRLITRDPRIPMLAERASGTAFDDAALLADEAAARSEYYAWQAAQGYRNTLFFKLVHNQAELGAIAITRRKGRGAHDDAALAAAGALAPRLTAAAAVSRHIAALEGLNNGLELALAAGARAFALFGRHAELLHANPAFQAAFDRRDGLTHAALSAGLHAVVAECQPRALLIPRAGGATPYRLVLQPVTPQAAEQRRFDWGRHGAVLVFLDDPDAAAIADRAPVLRTLFGLTAAEARVAVLIAEGDEIEAIALRLGVAASTVRTQLKRIFLKLGVNRQLGVAQLVRSLPKFDG
jgi:DNA-binding CsgD family transcriptional regulator